VSSGTISVESGQVSAIKSKGTSWAPVSGIAFAIFMFLAVALVNAPHKGSDEEITAWWSNTSNQEMVLLSGMFMTATAVAMLFVVANLRHRLKTTHEISGVVYHVATTAGAVAAVSFLISRVGMSALAQGIRFDDQPVPGPDLLRFFPQTGYSTMSCGLFMAATMALLAGWLGLRTGALSSWFSWASLVLGPILFVGTALLGPFAIPVVLLWAVLFSLDGFRFGSSASA
jgi:hypothetical protein